MNNSTATSICHRGGKGFMPDTSEFDRGHAAGEISARLAAHDKHFEQINGSIADSVKELRKLTLAIQSLADASEADRNTVKATALALAEADEARRRKVEESWSPRARLYVLLGTIATILIALGSLYATFHK